MSGCLELSHNALRGIGYEINYYHGIVSLCYVKVIGGSKYGRLISEYLI